ncbi:23S rRNA (adenine(2503)-C(2))-methyltransferase RlmN [Patescibacteria group bacterium]|nr:23S rRNA (adenine(2503)-C(2))-methyltransferase RlmN [Patescibacteria group bacterium]
MDLSKLNEVLKDEPSYRQKQAQKAVFQDLADNWMQVQTLPIELRKELKKSCPLKIDFQASVSQDEKVIKGLITLKDGLKVETVLMKHGDNRNTVCVSSQVGCPLGCVFCATGNIGFKRSLSIYEIVEQVLFFARYLKSKGPARSGFARQTRRLESRGLATSDAGGERITNVVFMGMGEPFLNYDNVLGAIRILNDEERFNLGARHFSISTVGIIEGIEKFSQEKLQVNLAISLHAPDDKLRSEIMPINKKYSVKEVLKAVDEYIKKTKRRVMFEYVMIKDVNDTDECAKELAKLVKKPLYFVNLILYNPTGIFKSSEPARIKRFKEILEKYGVPVTQRYRFGKDLKAACGQLAGK